MLLFAIATLTASGYVLLSEEQEAKDDPAEKAARGEIDGLDDLSLLREDNLRRVLDDVEDSNKPLITSLRISPVRINVTVRDTDGIRKVRSYDAAFDYEEDDFGVGEDEAFSADQIDAAAPERIAAAVAKRSRQPVEAIDYITRTASSDADSAWYIALDQGPARVRQWVAAADGSDIRKPGDPSKAQRAEQRRYAAERRRYEAEQKRQQQFHNRRSACFEAADDAQDLARCVEKYPV